MDLFSSVRQKFASSVQRITASQRNTIVTLPEVVVTAPWPPRNSIPNLVYPLGVDVDPQQGHYISFYIRKMIHGRLSARKSGAARSKAQLTINRINKQVETRDAAKAGAFGAQFGMTEIEAKQYAAAQEIVAETEQGAQAILMERRPTKRLKGAISLYMPPSVQVSYETKYADQEIGIVAETGYDIIRGFMDGTDKGEVANRALGGVTEMLRRTALATIETAAPGGKALYAIDRGRVVTPKMELMFEGIGRRNFSFSFVFIPKSELEAQAVKQIVKTFKYHMASDWAGEGSNKYREMSFPDQFDIEYMHMGTRNKNLNKIGTCALTKMDVEYGGDKYVAYEGPPGQAVPQTTKMTLNFTEFELVTKSKIAEGY